MNWESVIENPISIVTPSIVVEDLLTFLDGMLGVHLKKDRRVVFPCFFKNCEVAQFCLLKFFIEVLINNELFLTNFFHFRKGSAVEIIKIWASPRLNGVFFCKFLYSFPIHYSFIHCVVVLVVVNRVRYRYDHSHLPLELLLMESCDSWDETPLIQLVIFFFFWGVCNSREILFIFLVSSECS